MLFDYTYLLTKFDASFFVDSGNEVNNFIVPVDDTIIGRKPELFKILHNTKNRFCFFIPAAINAYSKTFIKEEIILNIVRLFFLPNYIRANDKYILFTEQVKSQENIEELYEDLYKELSKQGIKVALMHKFQADPSTDETLKQETAIAHPGLIGYLCNNGQETAFDTLTKTFNLPVDFDKKWIIPVEDTADFERKRKLIQHFEDWIATTRPAETKLIEKYNASSLSKEKLLSENLLLKFKLENSGFYLQLIRDESQGFLTEISNLRNEIYRLTQQILKPHRSAENSSLLYSDEDGFIRKLQTQITLEQNRANEILEWYKKEYEVLPMWYKRFGQLIKVFKGKRTFRSLFN